MKRVINISEVLGTTNLSKGAYEVCACTDASYDEAAGRLEVKLESFLRPAGLLVKEQHVRADWLPANELETESVDPGEAVDAARDIFRRWVRKVRTAMPTAPPG